MGPVASLIVLQLVDGRLLGGCSINDHKPWMCSSYPNDGVATFRGCGFNAGTESGLGFDAFVLEPLDAEEL